MSSISIERAAIDGPIKSPIKLSSNKALKFVPTVYSPSGGCSHRMLLLTLAVTTLVPKDHLVIKRSKIASEKDRGSPHLTKPNDNHEYRRQVSERFFRVNTISTSYNKKIYDFTFNSTESSHRNCISPQPVANLCSMNHVSL